MKLLSCYIAGFGKFVGQTVDLSQQIMFIQGENGWGKTTLADFLESMFYGIDGGRSKAVVDNKRLKYEPWSGAKFGGALTFEYAGKTYRVERTFGKTASADTVAVYDENHMQCYAFGERAERLGETLFGVDRESFKKTAYVPQNASVIGGFSPMIKDKLTQLLSATKRDNGAGTALDTLEKAERALRSKRKPAKGKLDELDDKIAYVCTQKSESETAQKLWEVKREECEQNAIRINQLRQELARMEQRLEEYARRNERVANRTARQEVENTLRSAQSKLGSLHTFFGGINPATLNTEGLERAIGEFYALKEEISALQVEQEKLDGQVREKESIVTKLEASRQTLDSYELLMDEQTRAEKANDKADKKNIKYSKKRATRYTRFTVLCLILAFAGAMLTDVVELLGIILLAVGGLGVVYTIVQAFRYTQPLKRKRKKYFADTEMENRYWRVVDEVELLEDQLKKFPASLEQDVVELAQTLKTKRTRLAQLDGAIAEFFNNFAMEERYDYRAGLALLKSRKAEYASCKQTEEASIEKLQTFEDVSVEENYSPADMQALSQEKQALLREQERLTAEMGRTQAQMQALEKTFERRADYEAEEERLRLEKARLEKRLTAIRYAKEILLRARSSMATKYIEPAQKSMRRYAEEMGLSGFATALRLQEEGLPVAEDMGGIREAGYYSVGMQDLFGLCLRFALAESIFPNGGVLILDDPFVNLDDDKTLRAKKLLYALSKKYQILYLTCKQERSL